MKVITTILDFLAILCVILLFSKFLILSVNEMFDWKLRWYFLEDIPHMAIILVVLLFIFAIPSEMIKEKRKK
ncbi:hypothetical protein GZH82_13670 [Staphylococcus ursi]|uniref:epilancin biosynthesis-related protein ElxI1 n=1 Tax=Staphylococcus sp. MI 10-1553 TaxID=1912064 RepID=UPI001398E799|nr:hypothetical protein [Staphylococcus sp. MI 10-1553]QHW38290.1 hypothetical protein GZH82_13670 [Staphylococcus sp. MI 10-1553]